MPAAYEIPALPRLSELLTFYPSPDPPLLLNKTPLDSNRTP